MSIYPLEIYRKPLEAIISGRKKVEIRTNNSYENIDYTKLEPYDIIKFQIINQTNLCIFYKMMQKYPS